MLNIRNIITDINKEVSSARDSDPLQYKTVLIFVSFYCTYSTLSRFVLLYTIRLLFITSPFLCLLYTAFTYDRFIYYK